MKYNHELQCIDTQEKAYLLGQIYGDGSTSDCNRSYKVGLASIIDDKPLYEKLSTLFPFFKLVIYPYKPNIIRLENYKKALYEDLVTLGMKSDKTVCDRTGEFHFPNLPEELEHHFIRGYFDADGAFWYPTRKRSRNNLHAEFGCNTPNFLEAINQILIKNGIIFTKTHRFKKGGNGKYYESFGLFTANRGIAIKFANYIYKDSTICLERKYKLAYREKDLRPLSSDLYGPCPYCNSTNLERRGKRQMKTRLMRRLFCRDCGKLFSVPMPTSEVTQSE